MKQKLLVSTGIAVLLVIGIVTAVMAFEGAPTADMWVSGAGTVNSANPLIVTSSNVGAGCSTYNGTAFLKFNISSISSEPVSDKMIGSATLTVTTGTTSSIPAAASLALLSVSDDTWTEAVGSPVVGSPLVTVTVGPGNLAPGTVVTFPSTPALVNFINQQSSSSGVSGDDDDVVSLAIRFTACTNVVLQQFQDRSTGTPPLLTLANPNAVTLGSFEAAEPAAPRGPFYLAFGVLATVLVGATYLLRRRAVGAG